MFTNQNKMVSSNKNLRQDGNFTPYSANDDLKITERLWKQQKVRVFGNERGQRGMVQLINGEEFQPWQLVAAGVGGSSYMRRE
jgi:hypothetical protein